jgi:hypothetical protein
MAKITARATYKKGTLRGAVRVFSIVGKVPQEYEIVLIDDRKGLLSQMVFATIETCLSHATKFNFLSHEWEIELIDT